MNRRASARWWMHRGRKTRSALNDTRPEPRRRIGAVRVLAVLLATLPPWHRPLERAAAADEPAPFVPGEISIGEPLPLPARGVPAPATPPFTPPAPFPAPTAPPAPVAVSPPAPRTTPPAATGWFGWTLDDSVVTGRVVVADVTADGPAARAGIRPHDMLLAIDGHRLSSADDLAAALAAIPAGRAVPASVARASGIEELVITPQTRPKPGASAPVAAVKEAPAGAVTQAADWQPLRNAATIDDKPAADGSRSVLAPPPSPLRRSPPPGLQAAVPTVTAPLTVSSPAPPRRLDAGGTVEGRPALGVRTLPVDPATQSRFGLPHASGALVIGVVHELPAARAGVPPGAVIVALDERPVESPEDLSRLVADGPVGTPLTVRYILPGGRAHEAEVSLERLAPAVERALSQPATSTVPSPAADE